MALDEVVHTFGRAMQARYGERIHKLAIDAGFTCPNRDGSQGTGGCTFCNNSSFSPNGRNPASIAMQVAAGRGVIAKRTRAKRFLAYFQAYTNTYDDQALLRARYDEALRQPGVVGLSIGTRPDCVPEAVLDLLCEYRDRGHEIWLELGVQSSFDHTLERVRRGHGFQSYRDAVRAARSRGLQVCTHLIIGLPGEQATHAHMSLARVLEEGVDGLKLHPLHVVKGTQLANEWRHGEYHPLSISEYIRTAADLIERTPPEIIYHRVTGTVAPRLLLAPEWCQYKWRVLNGIERELLARGSYQGARLEDNACLH